MMSTPETITANKGSYASEAQALEAIVTRIVEKVDPEAIWLFGSRARGTNRSDSDFDLLVVTRLEDGESGYDYDRVYAPVLGTGVGCDVVPCRMDDFLREAESPTGLVREVLQTGVSLYEKPEARQSPPTRG
jgi:predicted nucleotidyltransferase